MVLNAKKGIKLALQEGFTRTSENVLISFSIDGELDHVVSGPIQSDAWL